MAPQTRDRVPLILTAALVLVVLLLNIHLFTQPIVETSDFAANSLLVQQAKHFALLTGHYSRWHFHHPGPAFLYLFALGESLFYDLLHLVPAPYNAQVVIMIVFNGVLLCAALCVFRRNAKLSVPLALLATTVLSVLVNVSSFPGSYPPMLISNWMPDVMLFPFLLFAVAAASVLAGQTRDLPVMAVSGMLLIHAHVAQFLFVGVIGGGTVAYIVVREGRAGRLRSFLSERRRDFVLAAAAVFLFALPVLLEAVLDKPNNPQAVWTYLHELGGERNTLRIALGYSACFVLFIGTPETALLKGPVGLLATGLSRNSVVAYWVVLALLLLLAIVARRVTAKKKPRALFLGYLTGIAAGSAVLFIYWATRIIGGLFAFNGTFVYALHLLAWFLLLAELEPYLAKRAVRILNRLALACLLVFAIVERKALRSAIKTNPDALAAAAAVPASGFGTLAITFTHDNWGPAVELANSMKRMGKPFCVSPDWGFMFSRSNVCPALPVADKLWVATGLTPCTLPCRRIYGSATLSVTRIPARQVALPVETGPAGSPGLDRIGFNEPGGPSYAKTQRHAAILFWLSPEPLPTPCFRIAVRGSALPGRPAQLSVNGRLLGTLSNSGVDTALFEVPRGTLRPGEVNGISLDTENAGPVGADKRELGFAFVGLVLRATRPDESCVAM